MEHQASDNISGSISTATYVTDKGEQTALYKINKNISIKTSKIINIQS